jgi:hypothetical protein
MNAARQDFAQKAFLAFAAILQQCREPLAEPSDLIVATLQRPRWAGHARPLGTCLPQRSLIGARGLLASHIATPLAAPSPKLVLRLEVKLPNAQAHALGHLR